MTDRRCKYNFNWLDHLYYTGKDVAVWSVWFYFEFVFCIVPLLLLLCCVGAMLIRQTANVALIHISIYAACALAVVLYLKRWLKMHRFTPQRESAYFRRYPQRKHYKPPFVLTIVAFLLSSMSGGFLIYLILRWADSPNI